MGIPYFFIGGYNLKEEAIEVLTIIENLGYKAYLIGGYPRDFYIGKPTDDYDICTNATPDIIENSFEVSSPEKHGSIKIKYKDISFDITTFRIESDYQDVRTPVTTYTESLIDDIQRRDFTINSICIDKHGEYIDLLGGLKDIDSRIIKCIGDPSAKLAEDPLRILRAIRFATVLDFSIDEDLERGIMMEGSGVSKLSYYRRKEELDRIFASNHVAKGIELIKKYHLGQYLELNFDGVVPIPSAIEMWGQLDYPDQYPFTRTEKKKMEQNEKNI